MAKTTLSYLFAGGYLLGLLVAYTAVGWILAAYATPALMWMWTLALMVYVAWAGAGAIAASMLWVVSVVWIAAYTSATPLHVNWQGSTWAISLLGVWLFAISVVLMLAFAHPALQSLRWSRKSTFYRVVITTGIGLILGRCLYWSVLPGSSLSTSV
ncbi:MAG: hypothetical protein HC851_11485 [Acaryochloris sp. RU_4_1]|nr:hypothetical protein [Acaryochloris sp. SU_5_25]NJM66224.1 hypothetical protein [Acaryochloris sp. RU_4_1]NJR55312.1 hypothetical protein [Acaryochloris sp. CRU_2_0]